MTQPRRRMQPRAVHVPSFVDVHATKATCNRSVASCTARDAHAHCCCMAFAVVAPTTACVTLIFGAATAGRTCWQAPNGGCAHYGLPSA